MKVTLRGWNRHVFGHVNHMIKELEQRIEWVEFQLQSGFDKELEMELLVAITELSYWENNEEIRLAQIAKKKWLDEGDHNSKFFHAVANMRRQRATNASMSLPDGVELRTVEEVHLGAVKYFEEFLNGIDTSQPVDLSSIVSKIISNDENEAICKAQMGEEVQEALLTIPRNSSPGPDNLGSAFFISCWDIVKEGVVEAACDFILGNTLPRYYSSSFIVLIPKIARPKKF
ncbi:hypothetical protein F2P56_024034 [Juglans regia]|uniref:Uncharacterized protein n=2 Tax=Juglans regia TaxID=51240 RepID=A0A833UBD3_JUGRE|nr:uncharacterized protein LOC108998089 [Juglans regia]KAF5454362.1 hypothetical protein F2P56_024034 [Juglans regia]